jgi:aerobic carbon-monoxide dehydrogenase medium subunit
MKAPPFGYVRAASISDALRLLAAHGDDAKFLAGGQSLLAALAFRLSEPSTLIDISKLPELAGITRTGDSIRVGAGTTHAVLARDPLIRAHVPLLAEAVPHIAHTAIRNRGTIGGSLAYADPAAELPACCVALDAVIAVISTRGSRRIPAAEFFTGLLSTALEDGEMITAVEFPIATAHDRGTLVEIARRSGDYAMAGVVVVARVDGEVLRAPKLVFFGVGDTPVVASRAATALDGYRVGCPSLAAAQSALAADLDPPPDQHGGPDMKRQLARTILARALSRLLAPQKVPQS